jgi:hypothetical protein
VCDVDKPSVYAFERKDSSGVDIMGSLPLGFSVAKGQPHYGIVSFKTPSNSLALKLAFRRHIDFTTP